VRSVVTLSAFALVAFTWLLVSCRGAGGGARSASVAGRRAEGAALADGDGGVRGDTATSASPDGGDGADAAGGANASLADLALPGTRDGEGANVAADAAELAARFARLDAPIASAIAEAKMPGCVVVIGRRDEILFRRAYGSRSVVPERRPMTLDTVFDLASLTKPIATATSIMILVERGQVDLDARAARYVPELTRLPPFTVRQLLLHTSGLPAATPMSDYTADRASVMRHIADTTFRMRPGEKFLYSDVGYVVLEEVVRRVTKSEFASFAANEIFTPLGMTETGFLPPPRLRARSAPTEQRDGAFLRGEVHDPRAFALGGVAGHAGVFSTADDLARFARAMLGRGELDGRRILSDKTFASFVARRETSSGGRALGGDVDSRYATHKGTLSARAFGHGGFTGTALWVDPARDLFVVFLSNRVHPDGKGVVNPLIGEIATMAVNATDVQSGIDVLRAEGFARLRGAHVGLVTNASARAGDGRSTIDVLKAAPGVKLEALFTPEHGLDANREGAVSDGSAAGVPIYSLYGERASPTTASLANVDTLVFDLQDAGTRFYTYASTMKRVMKTAADRGLRFVVLDRPNPLGGLAVEGPVLPTGVDTFVNHHPLPVRHGMTMGELAKLFAADERMTVSPEIVELRNWRRNEYFDQTGLAWVNPSPNLRTVQGVVLYPMLGLLEATNLSVGRGTDEPFELFGAPWLDVTGLQAKLTEAKLEGLAFTPVTFTPRTSTFAGKSCRGLRVTVTDRSRFHPVQAALALVRALRDLHPSEWQFDAVDKLLQYPTAMKALDAGARPADVEGLWANELAAFEVKRRRFLIYR
jgi:uncharacterized protein YbbC (DUF1343 family)